MFDSVIFSFEKFLIVYNSQCVVEMRKSYLSFTFENKLFFDFRFENNYYCVYKIGKYFSSSHIFFLFLSGNENILWMVSLKMSPFSDLYIYIYKQYVYGTHILSLLSFLPTAFFFVFLNSILFYLTPLVKVLYLISVWSFANAIFRFLYDFLSLLTLTLSFEFSFVPVSFTNDLINFLCLRKMPRRRRNSNILQLLWSKSFLFVPKQIRLWCVYFKIFRIYPELKFCRELFDCFFPFFHKNIKYIGQYTKACEFGKSFCGNRLCTGLMYNT